MAEPGRTVRVSGLPTDMDNNRLQDKLLIHFLRARNGGGEIDSLTIVEAMPLSALITFEDSAVAQRVIQHSRHILEIDGKKYKLTATKHHKGLDPDRVIISLSATVDYSRLPEGIESLTKLRKIHRDIQINHSTLERRCVLFGSYSEVQAALAQLLGYPGSPGQEESKDSGRVSPNSQVSEDQSRKPSKQKEHRKTHYTDWPSNEENVSKKKVASGGEDDSDNSAPRSPTAFMEDFSLMVDADMFQYLQKHCRKQYQHILSQYGVEVINETNQGLTTLFLQTADTAAMEDGTERLKQAKKAISQLYQENETKICRGQLPKAILHPRGGLQRALENLSVRFPKLLLNEDEQNIYIIGSSRDVTEGKRLLLLDADELRDKNEDVASLLKFSSYNPDSSPCHANKGGASVTPPSTAASFDERIDQMPRSEEDDLRADGARKYKLAARFKDTGLVGLGSRPTDFTLRANSLSSRQMHQGPLLGYDVLSGPTGISGEAVSGAQNTGGDILFKKTPTQVKTSSNTDMMDTQLKNSGSSFSTTNISESIALPPFGSGSTLKRASSFSGTPQQKAQVVGQKSQDDSSKPATRTRERSSSFSSQTVRDRQEVHNAEISLSMVMWRYIKEAYSTRVEDLTTDVQVKERRSETGKDLTVVIRGADSSKVRVCQERLQKLVNSVSVDFSIQQVDLSELGVADSENETLQACFSEVRSRFKKVSIHVGKKSVYLIGPNQLSSQVAATLREVFSGEHERVFSSPSQFMLNSSQFNVPQSSNLYPNINSQMLLGKGKADDFLWKTTYGRDFGERRVVNGSYSHMTKETGKFTGSVEEDGQMAERFISHSLTQNNTSPVNGVQSTVNRDKTKRLDHAESTGQRYTPEESRSDQVYCSVCRGAAASLVQTTCGVPICTKCLETSHLHCRVCSEKAETPPGIHGEIKKSRLQMSLPGHNKDATIKITYRIPDGIQGEGHPSPGKPFKGGVFEAFLPDNDKAKKLLPRLAKAFRQGLTFTVTESGTEARVTWDCIPHKTGLQGGKSQKGYPDSGYLTRLSEVLTSKGIE